MKRLLFFINPNAGHAEIRGTLMEVLEIFSAGGYEVTVHMTTGPRDLTRQIAARGAQYDLIVCTGGDGTLNEAVSGLMALPYEKRPKLGYIPGGTVNDVASTLGLSKDTVRAAQEIMDGHPFPLDIGSFGPDRFFTYVAAFGIFTDVPYETPQEDKRIWGRLAYIMNGAGALGRLKPTHVRVSYGDHQEEADVLVGLVTSTTSVGGFKTTRDLGISLNDGLYEMILVRATKNLAEFNLAATRALRLDFDNDSFISAQTNFPIIPPSATFL
jgi:diacylglycerol kinase (ATP)